MRQLVSKTSEETTDQRIIPMYRIVEDVFCEVGFRTNQMDGRLPILGNPYWAENGDFRIKRGSNEGGIEDPVVAPSPSTKWSRAGGSVTGVIAVEEPSPKKVVK